jgi:hypothetical protein
MAPSSSFLSNKPGTGRTEFYFEEEKVHHRFSTGDQNIFEGDDCPSFKQNASFLTFSYTQFSHDNVPLGSYHRMICEPY